MRYENVCYFNFFCHERFCRNLNRLESGRYNLIAIDAFELSNGMIPVTVLKT